jgi:hypothetical protein
MRESTILMAKLPAPTCAFVALSILLGSFPAAADVRPLHDSELAKIIGMHQDCIPQGGACQNMADGCVFRADECASHCEHRYQNWECGRGDYRCETDDPRECGTQQWGVCDQDLDCVYYGSNNCGDATDCHRVN